MSSERYIEIGQALKAARVEKNLTVDDVSRATKINSRYIKAIESSNALDFINDVYYKGYVKIYANYLKVHVDLSFEIEKPNYNENIVDLPRPQEIAQFHVKTHPFWKLIILGCVMLVIIIYETWYLVNHKTTNHIHLKEHIIKSAQSFISYGLADNQAQLQEIADSREEKELLKIEFASSNEQVLTEENSLVLIASQPTTLKIFDENSRLLKDANLQEGEIYFVPKENSIIITSDNEKNIEFLKENSLQSIQELYTYKLSDKNKILSARYIPDLKD